jgi:hypothetical protein
MLPKILFGVLAVCFLLIVIGLIVDTLGTSDTCDVVYGATEYSFDCGSGFDGDAEYTDLCDGGNGSDDACDIEGRGIVFIICEIVAIITGLIALLAGVHHTFGVGALGIFGNKIIGLSTVIVCGVAAILGALIWWIGSPLFDDEDDEIDLGISVWLCLIGGIGYLVCVMLPLKFWGQEAA